MKKNSRFVAALIGLSLSAMSFGLHAEEDHANGEALRNQDLLERGSSEFEDSSNVNTYVEGIPPIKYDGKLCSQSQASQINGSKSVNVSCYFEKDGVERQCTFRWSDIDNDAEITIQTYEHKEEGAKKISIQRNKDIASKWFVRWKDVAERAQKMISAHCGADISGATPVIHTNEPIFKLSNGTECELQTQANNPDKPYGREIYCYLDVGSAKSTQCHVQENRSFLFVTSIEHSVTKYKDRQSRDGNEVSTQETVNSNTDLRLSKKAFIDKAKAWLEANCKK